MSQKCKQAQEIQVGSPDCFSSTVFPRDLGTSLGDYNWSGCALIKISSGPSPRSDMHTPSCWAIVRSYVCAKKTAIIRLKKQQQPDLPVEDKVEARGNHLDSLEPRPHAPAVVVNTHLRPLGNIQQHQGSALCKQPPSYLLIHRRHTHAQTATVQSVARAWKGVWRINTILA